MDLDIRKRMPAFHIFCGPVVCFNLFGRIIDEKDRFCSTQKGFPLPSGLSIKVRGSFTMPVT